MQQIEASLMKEVDLLDLCIVLLKRKYFIAAITGTIALVSIAISFLFPPIYRASTKILPPMDRGGSFASQLFSQIGGVIGLAGVNPAVKSQSELYVELLKSRTISDRVIDHFDLMRIYNVRFREDARARLQRSMNAREERKSGLISIDVEDRDPKLATDIANTFVEELKKLSGGLAISEAAQRRLFFEEKIKPTKENLLKAEEAMKGFQQRTGAFQIDTQAKAVIEGIAQLRARIAAKEVENRVLRTFQTAQNPELQQVEEELRALQAELEKLETGSSRRTDPFVSTEKLPALGTEYFQKLRELKYNETLYELLVKQYEAAKIDEARDPATIQVVDYAVVPGKKVKPRRLIWLLVGALGGFLISVVTSVAAEYAERSAGNQAYEARMKELKRHLSLFGRTDAP